MSLRGSVCIAVSADGDIARKSDALDWLDRVQLAGEDYGYAAFMSTNVLVMGRRTYIPASVRPGLVPNIHS